MAENLIVLIDCSQTVGKTPTSKLHPLFSNLTDKYNLCVCFLISSEQSQENYQQLSKDLKGLTYSEHIVQADSNPKLLFLAKRYIDDKNYNDILILSSAIFIPNWKALTSILLTASAYKINFESLDTEPIDEPVVDLNTVEDDCHNMLKNISTEEPVKILRSDIIPQDIFYHGFSTRLGGVSSIQSLKSLNLYYTSAKKDPKIVIAENIHRLAKAGGFQPDSLRVRFLQIFSFKNFVFVKTGIFCFNRFNVECFKMNTFFMNLYIYIYIYIYIYRERERDMVLEKFDFRKLGYKKFN